MDNSHLLKLISLSTAVAIMLVLSLFVFLNPGFQKNEKFRLANIVFVSLLLHHFLVTGLTPA